MNITLKSDRLHYISLGASRIHARMTRADAADKGQYTVCGLRIPDNCAPEALREMDASRLCKRCYATLRAYSSAFVEVMR